MGEFGVFYHLITCIIYSSNMYQISKTVLSMFLHVLLLKFVFSSIIEYHCEFIGSNKEFSCKPLMFGDLIRNFWPKKKSKIRKPILLLGILLRSICCLVGNENLCGKYIFMKSYILKNKMGFTITEN